MKKNEAKSKNKGQKNLFLTIIIYLFALLGLYAVVNMAISGFSGFNVVPDILIFLAISFTFIFFARKKLHIKGIYPPILYGLFIIGVLSTTTNALFYYADWKAYQENPTKNIASIMPPFAEKHNLELIEENNNPAGISNAPYYSYHYLGDQSIDELSTLINIYLKENGYSVQSEKKLNEEIGNSYWIVEGINEENNVDVTIWTDVEKYPEGTRMGATFTINNSN